jgi:acyl carrier protein
MREVLERHFGVDASQVTADRRLDTLGLDSLSFVEFTFELEKRLDLLLPDVPRDLATAGDLAAFVERVIEAKARDDAGT